MILPAPDNWQTFEDLCHRLWSSMWGEGTQKNGRQGQPQNGVDVFGIPPYSNKYAGVQCKGKNGNYGSALKTNEVDAECKNAENFIPKISKFIMATTSPRDAQVQQHCRELSANKKFPFDVETWSWDDISGEIQYRKEIMDYFYHEFPSERTNKSTFNNIFFSSGRVDAFFSRDHIKNLCDIQTMGLLQMLSFEIIDNAFQYGRAQTCSIEIEKNNLIIKDNGNPFNALDLQNGRGGTLTIQLAKRKFPLMDYKYEEEYNIITVPLPMNNSMSDRYEIRIDSDKLMRGTFCNLDKFVIPDGTKEVIINIADTFVPISGVCRLYERFILNIKDGIAITIYFPDSMADFVEVLNARYSQKNINCIIR